MNAHYKENHYLIENNNSFDNEPSPINHIPSTKIS